MEGVAFVKALNWCDGIAVVGGGLFGTGASPLVKILPGDRVGHHGTRARHRLRRDRRLPRHPGPRARPAAPLGAQARVGSRVRDEVSAATLGDNIVRAGRRRPRDGPRARPRHRSAAQRWPPRASTRPCRCCSSRPRRCPTRSCSTRCRTRPRRSPAAGSSAAARWRASRSARTPTTASAWPAATRCSSRSWASGWAARSPCSGPQLPPALAKAVVGEADALFGLRLHALDLRRVHRGALPRRRLGGAHHRVPRRARAVGDQHPAAGRGPARLGRPHAAPALVARPRLLSS